jgi:rubrerythrin
MTLEEISDFVSKNAIGEYQAITGYFEILNKLKTSNLVLPSGEKFAVPPELIADITEIISDELNHANKLAAWITKLSSISPAKD